MMMNFTSLRLQTEAPGGKVIAAADGDYGGGSEMGQEGLYFGIVMNMTAWQLQVK